MSIFSRIGLFSLCLSLIFWGCSSSTEPVNEPTVIMQFKPDAVNISAGEETSISLEFSKLTTPIFGMSLQISYDTTYVSFSDTLQIESGDFLGTDALTFTRISDSTIYLTITRIQGQDSAVGASVICTLPVTGRAVGSSTIELVDDSVHLFDSAGDEIEVARLETGIVAVSVK